MNMAMVCQLLNIVDREYTILSCVLSWKYYTSMLLLCLVYQPVVSQFPGVWTTTSEPTLGPFDIRLVDGSSPSEGRLEVFHDGKWGTVCDDSFELADGNVACRQLGYDVAIDIKDNAFYGSGNGNIFLDEIRCVGNEQSLDQCGSDGWGQHHCNPSEDVGVRCAYLKDGEVPIKLEGSDRETRGSIRVFYNETWISLCRDNTDYNDEWGVSEANVACRQLGYESTSTNYNPRIIDDHYRDYYDYRDYYEHIDEQHYSVRCNGNETNFGQCRWFAIDSRFYRCSTALNCGVYDSALGAGKIVGIAVACILMIVLLVIVILVILRFKRPKLTESPTTGSNQANAHAQSMPVMFINSPNNQGQAMLPYGSPPMTNGQSVQIAYPLQQQQVLALQQPFIQPTIQSPGVQPQEAV